MKRSAPDKARAKPPRANRWAVGLFALCTLIGVMVVSPYALLSLCLDGLAATMVLAPLALAGLWQVPLFHLGKLPLRWHLLLGAMLGIGAGSLLVLGLGSFGVLHRSLWVLLLTAMTAVGIVRLRDIYRDAQEEADPAIPEKDNPRPSPFLWLLASPFLVLAICAASHAPGFLWAQEGYGYDVLEYHLQVPREYHDAGRITYLPHNVYANFPMNVEMLYLMGMIILEDPVESGTTANMIHLMLAMLTVAGAWVAGCEWSRRAGYACAMLTATAWWLVYLSGLAYVEHGMLFFGMVATGALFRSAKPPEGTGKPWRWWAIAGIAAGLACGCKYTAVPMIALPLGVMLLIMVKGNKERHDTLQRALSRKLAAGVVFALGTAVAFMPWLIKNAILTGNPVFPLANGVFHASPPGWGEEQTAQWNRGHATPEKERALTARASAFWNQVPADAYQRFGPLLFLVAAAAFVRRRIHRLDVALLAMWLLQLAVWLFATHLYARFAVVMLIPLALLGGRALMGEHSRARWYALLTLLILGAPSNLTFAIERYRMECVRSGTPAALMYHGKVSGFEHLAWLNDEIPDSAHIMLVGEARGYYVQRDADYFVVFNRNPFIEAVREAKTDAAIVDWLRDRGYTHVLINWSEVRRLRATYGFDDAITPARFDRLHDAGLIVMHEYAHPVSGGRYVTVYEVAR